jgi:hypothetical protein
MARKQSANGKRTAGPKRRYLVCGLMYSMNFGGKVNPIGCNTLESAERAFSRRAAQREGAVVLYDRKAQRILRWNDEVEDSLLAARYWFGAP